MVEIFVTPSCTSCRKAISWFEEQNIPFKEVNLLRTQLEKDDILRLLSRTENGFSDIISSRSKYLVSNEIDVEEMRMSEVIDLIIEHPTVLKRPIIVDHQKLMVGFNEEEIRCFIPRERRDANNHVFDYLEELSVSLGIRKREKTCK